MSWDFASIGYYLVSIVGAVGTYVLWSLKGKFVTKEEFEEFIEQTNARFQAGTERMGKLTGLIERVSLSLDNLPTKDDVHNLALAMREVGGDLKAMRETARGIEGDITELRTTVRRHEEIMTDAVRSK